MAELFDVSHEDGELTREVTTEEFSVVQSQVSPHMRRTVTFYNLDTSYISTAEDALDIELADVHADLQANELELTQAKKRHNAFLVELGLAPLPL